MCLFAIYYFIGKNSFFENQKLKFNSFQIIGKLGILYPTFHVYFQKFLAIIYKTAFYRKPLPSPEFIIATI